MELTVRSRNIEVTDDTRQYAQRRISRFARLLPDLDEVAVELHREGARDIDERFVAQITTRINGAVLRVEERASNLFAAIDLAAATLRNRVERFQTRDVGKIRAQRRQVTAAEENAIAATEPQEEPSIVRIKRFPIEAMTPEEATNRMELLGHNFYFFLDVESEQYAVVYRRTNGDYGLIEPQAV